MPLSEEELLIPHQSTLEEPVWLRELQTKEPIKIEIEHFKEVHNLRIVVISDTHGFHHHLKFPECPKGREMILIHCGDMSDGTEEEVREFNEWLGEIKNKFSKIYCICGNHETAIAKYSKEEIQSKYLTNCNYVQDEEFLIGGLKFYASPWCPNMYEWLCLKFGKLLNQPEKIESLQNYDNQFFFKSDTDREKIFSKIPVDVDVLVTHAPPKYFLDKNEFLSHNGCNKILEKLSGLHKMKIHLFGHIHSTNGYKFVPKNEVMEISHREKGSEFTNSSESNDDILFVNAANFNRYQPFYFDL